MRVDWEDEAPLALCGPGAAEMGAGLERWARAQGLRGVCFFQTSGSEGRPKWVGLTRAALLHGAGAVNGHLHADAGDVWLVALPLHHVGGFAILARAHLCGAGVRFLPGKWLPQEYVRACAGVTLSSLVPTQVYDLVRERLPCPAGVRAVVVGGGGMSQALAEAARELGWPVLQSYGMTEAGSQVATQVCPLRGEAASSAERLEDLLLLPHWQADTVAEGRLRLRGPALAAGYAVADADADGGWVWQGLDAAEGLVTRDHVRLRVEGGRTWLTFLGRESGFVKILGELLHLAAEQARLEGLALRLGWGVMPVLLPVPDARAGTALILVCEAGCPPAGPLLEAFHAGGPRWLRVRETRVVGAFPRSALGKVREAELRQMLEMV